MADKAFSTYPDLGAVPNIADTVLVYDDSASAVKQAKLENLISGWRDLRAPLIPVAGAGVNDPTLSFFGPSGTVMQYKFAVDDEVFMSYHIDHDIKVGSTIYPHVHWASSGTSTATVKWEMEYTIANRTGEPAFPAPTTLDIEIAANSTAWAHQVTEHATGFTAPEIDALILVHLTRVTNGGTENTDDIFGLFVDMHYETQGYGTLNREDPFYG